MLMLLADFRFQYKFRNTHKGKEKEVRTEIFTFEDIEKGRVHYYTDRAYVITERLMFKKTDKGPEMPAGQLGPAK